jgi:hypothetical protein
MANAVARGELRAGWQWRNMSQTAGFQETLRILALEYDVEAALEESGDL